MFNKKFISAPSKFYLRKKYAGLSKFTLVLFILFYIYSNHSIAGQPQKNNNNKKSDIFSTREIILPNYQSDSLKQDLPIESMILDKKNVLWMVGRTSVWRWQLNTNQLQRINLLKQTEKDQLRKIISFKSSLIVMSNQKLFQITFDPVKLIKLKSSNPKIVSLNIAADSSNIFWLTTGGIYAADFEQQTLIHMNQTPALYSQDITSFIPENGSLWLLRGKKLFLRSLISNQIQSKLLLSTKNKLQNIHSIDDNIFVHTKYAVLRYKNNGELRQRIPVEGNRKLVLMSLNKRSHLYLFSDKLLEIFDLKNEKSYHYRLNIGIVKKARGLLNRDSTVALITDGRPRAFQLSGDFW